MKIAFDPEDMAALADAVAERVLARLGGSVSAGDAGAPMTAPEAAKALNLSEDSVRNMVRAGRIGRLPGTGKVLIPRTEIARLLEGK